MIEALFKAAAHALKDAISLSGDQSAVLSSKGVL
jgi:imidazoleglycerol phosphate dehydratase HisB